MLYFEAGGDWEPGVTGNKRWEGGLARGDGVNVADLAVSIMVRTEKPWML